MIKVIGRRELPIMLALALPAMSLWAFIEIADEVVEGSTAAVDRMLILALRSADLSDPIGPSWLEEMMRDFTALGGVGVLALITVAAIGYLLILGKHRAALAIFIAVAGGLLLSTLAKQMFGRPRPDLVPHGSHVSSASFPSGHSMMASVVYLTLAVMLARMHDSWRMKVYLLTCAVAVTLLVGVSRVYIGVHWPTDVLGGWSFGTAWALACWFGMLLLQQRGELESAVQAESKTEA